MIRQRDPKGRIASIHGHYRGDVPTRTYRIWYGMKMRCLYPKMECYQRYGAKGVTVCERWLSFENFLADMGVCPEKHTIDRIDNSKGYSPENCRWATHREQVLNSGVVHMLTHNGETLCITDWERKLGFSSHLVHNRLQRGWSIEKALSTPQKIYRPRRAIGG